MKESVSTEREIANGEARDSGRTPSGVERRRHTRHRLGQPIQIWLGDGRAYPAMAFEMSESGMSAATTNHLRVGEKVDLSPVAKYRMALSLSISPKSNKKASTTSVKTFPCFAACSTSKFSVLSFQF